jgi:hypothetical protein
MDDVRSMPLEDLNTICKGSDVGMKTTPRFVNPGASSPLVTNADRRTGMVSDAANTALRANSVKEPEQMLTLSKPGVMGRSEGV